MLVSRVKGQRPIINGRSRGSNADDKTSMVVLGEVEGAQLNIDGRVRHSNVADDFRRLPATIESCREVLAMVECCGASRTFEATFDERFGDGRRQ